MRAAVFGALLVGGFVATLVSRACRENQAFAGGGPRAPSSSELIALSVPIGQKSQQVTVIDPRRRVMSIYHIELSTGKIELRSVRNIDGDLQLDEYNAVHPLPREIRSLLQHGQ